VKFTYLCGLKIIRLAQGSERRAEDDWIAHLGAVTGRSHVRVLGLVLGELDRGRGLLADEPGADLVFWLGLRWWEEHERKPTAGPLLLCVYLMWLSVGLHLGVAIMGLPLMVLVALVDRRAAVVFAMPCSRRCS
jgi:hypothetical protein